MENKDITFMDEVSKKGSLLCGGYCKIFSLCCIVLSNFYHEMVPHPYKSYASRCTYKEKLPFSCSSDAT